MTHLHRGGLRHQRGAGGRGRGGLGRGLDSRRAQFFLELDGKIPGHRAVLAMLLDGHGQHRQKSGSVRRVSGLATEGADKVQPAGIGGIGRKPVLEKNRVVLDGHELPVGSAQVRVLLGARLGLRGFGLRWRGGWATSGASGQKHESQAHEKGNFHENLAEENEITSGKTISSAPLRQRSQAWSGRFIFVSPWARIPSWSLLQPSRRTFFRKHA